MVKYCINCGKKIPKKKTVSVRRHSQRKYCSQGCYRKWMNVNKEGWWRGTNLRNKHFEDPSDQNAVEALKEFDYI